MPLLVLHRMIAATLFRAFHGAPSIAPGFDALHFFRWFRRGPPHLVRRRADHHQAILARKHIGVAGAGRAALHPVIVGVIAAAGDAGIETTFDAPVIEAYGMTQTTRPDDFQSV